MSTAEAAQVLGVAADAEWGAVRLAYRDQIRSHHPDRAGDDSSPRAARIIEAFHVLDRARADPLSSTAAARPESSASAPSNPPPPVSAEPVEEPDLHRVPRWPPPEGPAPPVHRVDADTLLIEAPADETFRWLLDAAHDIGEITYVDRSVPIVEVLCQFEGEPATSLLISLQGRSTGTDAFCTVESIEHRPAPPAAAVVDLLELALHRRSVHEP